MQVLYFGRQMASSKQESTLATTSHLLVSIEEELSKDPNINVPERYTRIDHHQDSPALATPSFQYPISTIDMKQLVSPETEDFELEKLHSICMECGLFQVWPYSWIIFQFSFEINDDRYIW